MKKHSYKRALQERNLKKIKDEMIKEPENHICFFFPDLRSDDLHHIIPISQNQDLIDERSNLIPISNHAHIIIHTGTIRDLRRLPADKFREYLSRMEKLDKRYYSRYKMKFE